MQTIKLIVDAGKANAGPPLGPALGPLGINTMNVVNEINEKTKDLVGMQVPVQVIVDGGSKTFTVEVGTPLTSALLKKELNIKVATGKAGAEVSGNLPFDKVLKVCKAKYPQLISKSMKSAIKEVLGTCRSMGVTIDDQPASEILKKVNDGAYDDKLKA